MRALTTLILVISLTFISSSQSISKKRIDNLKKTIVRILIDAQPMGTGFVINQDGYVITCQHVIKDVFNDIRDHGSSKRKIEIEFQNGEKHDVFLPSFIYPIDTTFFMRSDFIILKSIEKIKTKVYTYKFADWNKVREGKVIFMAGYPFGIPTIFITEGIVSSKFNEVSIDTTINYSLLDITGNKGNSGCPVILKGNMLKKDKIIGIFKFIITPNNLEIYNLIELYRSKLLGGYSNGMIIQGEEVVISNNDIMSFLMETLNSNSTGIGGCVSIEYIDLFLRKYNLK